jgi:hypothetical protein
MATRPLPAGPLVRLEGSQLQRRLSLRYSVAVGDVDPYALADQVLVPLLVAGAAGPTRGTAALAPSAAPAGDAPGAGDADLPAAGSALAVEGAVVSAVVREGDALVVRVFNPTDEMTEVTVVGRRGWLVDLRGRPVAPFDGSFLLRGHGIATATLAPVGPG